MPAVLRAGGRWVAALFGRFGRSAVALRRPGPERDDLVLIVKGVFAAVVAWWLTAWLAPSSFLTFAPFTALLAVQGTVYRSVWESTRYLGALAVGVVLAGGFGLTTGPRPWALALLVAVALIAGRARPLGVQRTQVATVALFAFLSGGGQPGQLMDIVQAIAIGLATGIATDLALAAQAKYGDTREAVLRLSAEVGGLLRDMDEPLRDGVPTPGSTEEWIRRVKRLAEEVPRAYAAVERGEEKVRLNPRRVVTGEPASFPGYRVAVGTLGRVVDLVASMLRGLDYVARRPEAAEVSHSFISGLPALFSATADVLQEFGSAADEAGETVHALLQGAWDCYDELARDEVIGDLDKPGEWPVYGGILTDAARLLEELDNARRHALVPGHDGPAG
ncbi:MAG: hypothetical protein GEV11_24185 [Streptosporangiales bacterium]|nr:hypothetical protein [Streptosporangiales bacterium]